MKHFIALIAVLVPLVCLVYIGNVTLFFSNYLMFISIFFLCVLWMIVGAVLSSNVPKYKSDQFSE